MSQQSEDRQHENAAYPDEEIPGHLGVVDLFFVHGSKLAARGVVIHRVRTVDRRFGSGPV